MIKIIKTDNEYNKALADAEALVELDPAPGTKQGDQLELLTFLISKYEADHFALELPDPIEAIKFRMDQQGLSQKDLVPYFGSRSKVSEVLKGKRALSLRMIRSLHRGLGIPAEILLEKSGAGLPTEEPAIDWSKFPINELTKRNWFPNFYGTAAEAKDKAEELLRGLLKPLEAIRRKPGFYRQSVRSGSVMDEYALMAWQAKVLSLAQNSPLVIRYKKQTVTHDFISQLVRLSYFDEGPRLAMEFLNKNGIYIIILNQLPRMFLDGAAMTSVGGFPIVALTLRYDRLDNFWFTLCHELAHIALHFSENEYDCFFDDLTVSGDNNREDEADALASDSLISKEAWQSFPRGNYKTQAVTEFAEKYKIHPAIVAGRIRRERNNYRILSRMVGYRQVRKNFSDMIGDNLQ